MRILFATGIYPPDDGGPARHAEGMALALLAREHQVEVIAYGEDGSSITTASVSVDRVSRRGGAFVRYLRYAWRVFRAARKADVVYVQGAVSEGLPATIGAAFAGRPVVMRVPGDYAWEMAQQRGETDLLDEFLKKKHFGLIGLYERIERWTARRARRIIVPSQYLGSVVQRWGVPRERIEVVLTTIEPLPLTAGREAERQALGVHDRVVILSIVRAVPWKGIEELIGWWKDLPQTHLLVVGGSDGPDLEKWKTLAHQAGFGEDRIRFVGRLDRQGVARWNEAADAFVLHSGYEGYPHVIAEAGSRGVPCFVSDQGGNPETKETFGELIHVLPYRHHASWVAALTDVRQRTQASLPEITWTHERMVDAIEGVLKETVGLRAEGKMQLVMVSYDRALLDTSSEVFRRVSSIANGETSMTALVIAASPTPVAGAAERFQYFSFVGWAGSRMRQAIRNGIREARRLPGRTVITAQDPFAAGVVAYVISRWTNTPLELQEHGDFFSGEWQRESWKNRLLSWVGAFLLRRAERVRVVSERVKQDLIAIGVERNKIDIIPVSQNLDGLLARLPSSAAETVRIVAPCRFVEQKGLDVLLRAVTLLKKRQVPFHLTLIGNGPLEAKLRQRVESDGLSEQVSIEPWREPHELWERADLFVMASRYEGWGRTIVEAMAAGVPVVTTAVGCVGSFFRPQIDGRVVSPNDPSALAMAIEEQIREVDRRNAMRGSARVRAAEFPSKEELHEKQRAGWRSLLGLRSDVGPRWDLWVALLILAIVVSRVASVVLFHSSLVNREWGFFHLIDHWFQGYGYSYARELGCASAYRSPGFLFFLTAFYTVFSPTNTLAQAIVQNAFVVGVLWLVYAVGKRLVGKRAALIGSLLMVCYPYTFYHYTQYYHTFLSSFFLLLLFWFLLRFTERRRLSLALGAGLSIGCLAYVQGTILPATPFIVAWLLYRLWPEWKLVLKAAVIMAITSAALIAPWTYRNWKVFHTLVPLTTDLGHALFKANNEVIYELTKRGYPQEIVNEITVSSTNPNAKQYRMPPELEEEFKRDGVFRESVYWTEWHPKEPNGNVATCKELGPLNEVEFNAYWTGKAKEWMGENWKSEGWKLHLLKLKTFWQPSLFPSVKTGAAWSFAGSSFKVWLARNAVTAASALVIFGGLAGIVWNLRRRNKNVVLPIILLVVYSMMHTFFAGYTKYRIPLDNLLAIYAGWTIVIVWDAVRGRLKK